METETCCLCGQELHMLTNGACSENCCKSRGRRKGNERAEIRSTTKENYENQGDLLRGIVIWCTTSFGNNFSLFQLETKNQFLQPMMAIYD